jgi:small GTP-binding protein
MAHLPPKKEVHLVLYGDVGVGKSAISLRVSQRAWVPDTDPSSEQVVYTQLEVDGEQVKVGILDLKPQSEREGRPPGWLNKDVIVFVYSVTSQSSFANVAKLRQQCLEELDNQVLPMILIGNKSDLHDDRVVSCTEGQERAQEWNIPFFEVSAKKDIDLHQIFMEIVKYLKGIQPLPRVRLHATCICSIL